MLSSVLWWRGSRPSPGHARGCQSTTYRLAACSGYNLSGVVNQTEARSIAIQRLQVRPFPPEFVHELRLGTAANRVLSNYNTIPSP